MAAIQKKMDSFDEEIRADVINYLKNISKNLTLPLEIGTFPYKALLLDAPIFGGRAKIVLLPNGEMGTREVGEYAPMDSRRSCTIEEYVNSVDSAHLSHLRKIVDILVKKGYE